MSALPRALQADKPSLTKQLEQLIQEPGFRECTRSSEPMVDGAIDSMEAAKAKPVVEVSFDHVTDRRFATAPD